MENISNDDYYNEDLELTSEVSAKSLRDIESLTEHGLIAIILEETEQNFNFQINTSRNFRAALYLLSDKIIQSHSQKISALVLSILKNYFPHFSDDNQKLAVLLFTKNWLERVLNFLKINEYLHKNGNSDRSLPLSFPNFHEFIYLPLFYITSNEKIITSKMKDILKLILEYMLSLSFISTNAQDRDKIIDSLLSDLLSEFSRSCDSSLMYENIINMLITYEAILPFMETLVNDERMESSLYVYKFVIDNLERIVYKSDPSEEILEKLCSDQNMSIIDKCNTQFQGRGEILPRMQECLTRLIRNNFNKMIRVLNEEKETARKSEMIRRGIFLNNENFLKIVNFFLHSHLINNNTSTGNNLISLNYISESSFNISLLHVLAKCLRKMNYYNLLTLTSHICPLFIDFCSELFNEFCTSLSQFYQACDVSNIKENNVFKIYFNAVIGFLMACLPLPVPCQVVTMNYADVFFNLIVPGIKTSLIEKEAFCTDHQEYIRIIYDYTYNSKSEQIKSKVLRLLLKLCLTFDEIFYFVSGFYFDVLMYLQMGDNSTFNVLLSHSFTYLNSYGNFFNKVMLCTYTYEEISEQAFQILALLIYKISNRGMVNRISLYLKDNLHNFYSKIESEFLRSKFLTLIFSIVKAELKWALQRSRKEKDISMESRDIMQMHSHILNFLFENLFLNLDLNKQASTGSLSLSLNFLILEFLDEILFASKYLNNTYIVKSFTGCILEKILHVEINDVNNFLQSPKYLEFLCKIVKHYIRFIINDIMPLLKHLLSQAGKEIERTLQIKKKHSSNGKSNSILDMIFIIVSTVNRLNEGNLKNEVMWNVFDSLVTKASQCIGMKFEECLLKIFPIVIDNIQRINDNILFKCLFENYFKSLIQSKFEIQVAHLNLFASIMDLLIRRKSDNQGTDNVLLSEFLLIFKKFFSEGIIYFHRNVNETIKMHYVLVNSLLLCICKFNLVVDANDLNLYYNLLLQRLNTRPGCESKSLLSTKLCLALQLILLLLIHRHKNLKVTEDIIKNYLYLFDKIVLTSGDNSTQTEARISLIWCFKFFPMVFDDILHGDENLSQNQIHLARKFLQFIIEQAVSLTYVNSITNQPDYQNQCHELSRKKKKSAAITCPRDRLENDHENKCEEEVPDEDDDDYSDIEIENDVESSNTFPSHTSNSEVNDLDDDYHDEPEIDSLFELDLTKKDTLSQFNRSMTMEKFLKKRRYEYKMTENPFNIEPHLLKSEFFSSILAGFNEVECIRDMMIYLQRADAWVYARLTESLPGYVGELLGLVMHMRKVELIDESTGMHYTTSRKILKIHK